MKRVVPRCGPIAPPVVVRGEERAALDGGGEVVDHGVGDGRAVEGRRPAAQLVENYHGPFGVPGEENIGGRLVRGKKDKKVA